MNVLLVSEPGIDGVFRHVEGLAKHLLRQNIGVHLAYSDRKSSDRLFTLIRQIEESGGQTLNLRVGNAPGPADLPAMCALRSMAIRSRADVVHAHSSKAGALVRALPLTGLRKPIFYTPHAYYRMHDPQSGKARVFHVIEALLGRIGTTINMSRSERDFARTRLHLPEKRQLVIANGVDCAHFRPVPAEEKRRLREQLGLPVDAQIIGTVGRLSMQKDPLTMYEAFARVASEFPNAYLAHLGQGELAPEVDALVASHGLEGRVQRMPYMPDTSSFYQVLDGFVLTSLYEGMSYAILETLSTNLPLVLTRAPGNNDFGDNGLSHLWWGEPGDVESVAGALRNLLKAETSDAATCNHRAVTEREFSEDVCYSRVLDNYRAVA